jgi:hypothetical protein
VTSRAGRLAVALVTALAIISGCNNEQDGTAPTPAITNGQEPAAPPSTQLSPPSGNSEGATAPAISTDGPAAAVAPPPAAGVERTFELPPINPPESSGSNATASMPRDCSIPGSECDVFPGGDAKGDEDGSAPDVPGGAADDPPDVPGDREDSNRRSGRDDPGDSERSTSTSSGSATSEPQE